MNSSLAQELSHWPCNPGCGGSEQAAKAAEAAHLRGRPDVELPGIEEQEAFMARAGYFQCGRLHARMTLDQCKALRKLPRDMAEGLRPAAPGLGMAQRRPPQCDGCRDYPGAADDPPPIPRPKPAPVARKGVASDLPRYFSKEFKCRVCGRHQTIHNKRMRRATADGLCDSCAVKRRREREKAEPGKEAFMAKGFFSEQSPCPGCGRHENITGEPLRVQCKGLCSWCYQLQRRGDPLPMDREIEAEADAAADFDPEPTQGLGLDVAGPGDNHDPKTVEAAALEHPGGLPETVPGAGQQNNNAPCDAAASQISEDVPDAPPEDLGETCCDPDDLGPDEVLFDDRLRRAYGLDKPRPRGDAVPPGAPPGGDEPDVFSLAMAKAQDGPSDAAPFQSCGWWFTSDGRPLGPVARLNVPGQGAENVLHSGDPAVVVSVSLYFTGTLERLLYERLDAESKATGHDIGTVAKLLLLERLGESMWAGGAV